MARFVRITIEIVDSEGDTLATAFGESTIPDGAIPVAEMFETVSEGVSAIVDTLKAEERRVLEQGQRASTVVSHRVNGENQGSFVRADDVRYGEPINEQSFPPNHPDFIRPRGAMDDDRR